VEKFKTAMMTSGEPLTENEMNEMLKDLSVDEDGYGFSFISNRFDYFLFL